MSFVTVPVPIGRFGGGPYHVALVLVPLWGGVQQPTLRNTIMLMIWSETCAGHQLGYSRRANGCVGGFFCEVFLGESMVQSSTFETEILIEEAASVQGMGMGASPIPDVPPFQPPAPTSD